MFLVACTDCEGRTFEAPWRVAGLCDTCALNLHPVAQDDARRKFRLRLANEEFTGEVYAVQAVAGGPVKIGKAKRHTTARRCGELQVGNPAELIVRDTVPGYGHVEAFLHREFTADRIRGEWFRASSRLAQFFPSIVLVDTREDEELARLLAHAEEAVREEYGHKMREQGHSEALTVMAQGLRRAVSDDPELRALLETALA